MDPWATHIPLLAACVQLTQGPVLELGAGDYSTPLLHVLCRGRLLLTLESDPEWMLRYARLRSQEHHIVEASTAAEWATGPWSVVLVDGRPARQRPREIELLRPATECFVVHDTEPSHAQSYRWGDVLDGFRYRLDCERWPDAWTTVLSDRLDVRAIKELLPL